MARKHPLTDGDLAAVDKSRAGAARPPLSGRQGIGVTTSMNLATCIERGREHRVALNCEAVVVGPDGYSTDVILIDIAQHGF